MTSSSFVVVPWVTDAERAAFLREWRIKEDSLPPWLILQHDSAREGCAVTKNKGVARAVELGCDVVVVLDGDCYPESFMCADLEMLVDEHVRALEPARFTLFEAVTDPPSRGTPYSRTWAELPVAASMGFWTEVGDYCAVRQLAHGTGSMRFRRELVNGRYFPLCGMNLAFRPRDWLPWCSFVDVPRFDDIWMGWLWQKEAYRRGACFNLAGPLVRHARQSSVWKNLRDEAVHLEASEDLWHRIHSSPEVSYAALRALLPVP